MKLKVALAGACVLALTAGAASAAVSSHNRAVRHHTVSRRASASGRFAGPSQPIAYSKLAAYEKASPRARATQNWGLEGVGMAAGATGAAANASATAPQPGATTPNEMGASAPAPSTAAPNPPAPSAEPAGAPPATPDTSAAPPAKSPQ